MQNNTNNYNNHHSDYFNNYNNHHGENPKEKVNFLKGGEFPIKGGRYS